MTNSEATTTETIKTNAWGDRLDHTYNPDLVTTTSEGYTGHKYDQNSDLTYAHARYLSTGNKTWLSEDPMVLENFTNSTWLSNPQAQNSYSYAGNDPVNRVDPDGRFFLIDDALEFWTASILLSVIVGGNAMIGYGAITNNPDVIQTGFALQEIGVVGGSGMVPTGGYNNITGKQNESLKINSPETGSVSNTDKVVSMEHGGKYNFSQITANPSMSKGTTISKLVQGIKNGEVDIGKIDPIPVAEIDGNLIVGGNRRAVALTLAGVPQSKWPVTKATHEQIGLIRTRMTNNLLSPSGSNKIILTPDPYKYGVKSLTAVSTPQIIIKK